MKFLVTSYARIFVIVIICGIASIENAVIAQAPKTSTSKSADKSAVEPTNSPTDSPTREPAPSPTPTPGPGNGPTRHPTPPCDQSPDCVPYWVNGAHYDNCCPQGPTPYPTCTRRTPTGNADDRRTNIDKYADNCQAFLVFETPFLTVGSGTINGNDFTETRTIIYWLGPPQYIVDNEGNIESIVSRVIEYVGNPSSTGDFKSNSAGTMTISPAGFAATWNDVLRYYETVIAPNNGSDKAKNRWSEAGFPLASIIGVKSSSFVGAVRARWEFDPSSNQEVKQKLEYYFGQQATPKSFDYLYNYIVNNKNHLPPRNQNPNHQPKYPNNNSNNPNYHPDQNQNQNQNSHYYKKPVATSYSKPYWKKNNRLRGRSTDQDAETITETYTSTTGGGGATPNDSNPWDDYGN